MAMFITNTVLQNLITFLAPVVAIGLVIFVVVMSIKKISGKSTVKEIIGGALFFLLMLGLMYAAGSFQIYGNLFKNVVNGAITNVSGDANTILTPDDNNNVPTPGDK